MKRAITYHGKVIVRPGVDEEARKLRLLRYLLRPEPTNPPHRAKSGAGKEKAAKKAA